MSEEKNQNPAAQSPLETSFNGRTPRAGDIVKGRIVKITETVAFLEFGGRSQGYLRLSELKDENGNLVVQDGDEIVLDA